MRQDEGEELRDGDVYHPRSPAHVKKRLWKQVSMCETRRDIAWERRRRQILKQGQKRQAGLNELEELDLTDEDLHELKGCIELGFGFNEEAGHRLCSTIPALDLYLSVHRRAAASHASTSELSELIVDDQSSIRSGLPSPSPSASSEQLNVYIPGDDPQLVKTKLKHWAQAVGCSVRQSH
uniref:Uncharacterized protein n=1 Tax=Kalanchoe fedtschenkoi TaxID=63787 RepID=A0A7N0U0D3_KALFE